MAIKKIEEERAIGSFTEISSSHGIDVQYTQSNAYSLKIKAKAKLIEQIETTVESGILKICWKNELAGFLKAKFLQRSAVVIFVSAPVLNRIDLAVGSDFYADTVESNEDLVVNIVDGSGMEVDYVKANDVTIFVKRSSDIEIGDMKALKIVIENTAHSDVEIKNIEADDVTVTASGFSDTSLSGTVQNIAINAEGSSDTDIRELRYKKIKENNSKDSSIFK